MAQDDDTSLMQRAAKEIRELRRQNELLAAKVETMNLFAQVLHTAPFFPAQGATVDIAWELDGRVAAAATRASRDHARDDVAIVDEPIAVERRRG